MSVYLVSENISQSRQLNSQENSENSSNNPNSSKAGKIAYEVFGLIPIIGTFIGFHHAYKACKAEESTSGWEIAKIITQIFSFLLVPQVIYGVACAIKAVIDHNEPEYEFVDVGTFEILDNPAKNENNI